MKKMLNNSIFWGGLFLSLGIFGSLCNSSLLGGIGGLINTTIPPLNNTILTSTELPSQPAELVCNLPVVDGAICSTVCGPVGGFCVLGSCYCYCNTFVPTILKELGIIDTPTCKPSKNETFQAFCRDYICGPYNYTGEVCSLVPEDSIDLNNLTGSEATDICRCQCTEGQNGYLAADPNLATQDLCKIDGVNNQMCTSVCGVLGGDCLQGTCYCRCGPLTDNQLGNDLPSNSGCPSYQEVKDASDEAKARCNATCYGTQGNYGGNVEAKVCSLVPTSPLVLRTLETFLNPLLPINPLRPVIQGYETLAKNLSVCSCFSDSSICNSYA